MSNKITIYNSEIRQNKLYYLIKYDDKTYWELYDYIIYYYFDLMEIFHKLNPNKPSICTLLKQITDSIDKSNPLENVKIIKIFLKSSLPLILSKYYDSSKLENILYKKLSQCNAILIKNNIYDEEIMNDIFWLSNKKLVRDYLKQKTGEIQFAL